MMPFDLNTLGGRIAFARKALELTQAELAKLAGVGQSSIALLEGGSTKAPKRALELAQALQVSLEWLIHGESAEPSGVSREPIPAPSKKYASFAARLTMRREQCGFTQAQLATKSGLSQATIGNLETGRNKGTKRILELAQALHVTPEWLLHGGSLGQAKGDALRRDFGVPSREQQQEQRMHRLVSMQVMPTDDEAPKTTASPDSPVMLPILGWRDKALANPRQAHLSHSEKEFFCSPFEHSRTAFWMRISTDEMEPVYLKNDLILVDPELAARNSDDIVIIYSDGRPGFGRLRQTLNNKYIETLNLNYPDRMHSLEDGSLVVGVVHGMIRQPRARD